MCLNRRVIVSFMIFLTLVAGLIVPQPVARGAGPPYTWTGPTDIDPHLGTDILPAALQASNGTLWLAWQTFRFSNTRPDIIYRTLTNGVWSSIVRITSLNFNTAPAFAQLANGTILLFWSQQQTVNFNIYYERFSVNQFGVGTWSKSVHLTTTPFNDTAPAASVTVDGTLWLFWQRSNQTCAATCTETREIYYKTLQSGSWSSETKLTGSLADTNWNWLPTSTVTKNHRVWLAYSKGGQSSGTTLTSPIIYFKNFNGTTWSTETQATFPTSGSFGDQHASIIQDRNGTIWLFWARTSLTIPQFIIYNRFSVDNGQTWSPESQMTFEASTVDAQQPTAVQGNSASDKTIHLFYSSDRTGNDYDIWSLTSPSVSPVHDVGIVSATPSPNIMYAAGLPGKQSSNTTISVTVANYGDQSETVQTTVQVSNTTSTSLGNQILVIGVAVSITVYFPWNTTNAKPGRYSVSVSAFSTTSSETPGNQGDNSVFQKSSIWLLPWGDVDQDGQVTLEDVSVFVFDYGFGPNGTPCPPNHCHYFYFEDITNDGVVDLLDVGIAARRYGTFT